MERLVDENGVWEYDGLNDKFIKVETPSASYTNEPDPWSYGYIKNELMNPNMVFDETTILKSNLRSRIDSIKDIKQKNELQNLLESKIIEQLKQKEALKTQAQQNYIADHKNLEEQYRQAWKNRNILWRVFNQKYNPKKVDFEAKSDIALEIDMERLHRR